MQVPFVIFPLAMVGFFVASEKIMSTRSRWKELSCRYREALSPSPTLSWRGCRFLQTETKEGNTINRASYGSNRGRYSEWARMFPPASVAVDPKGLHFKRQPWHFMHPPLLIPWTAISGIETKGAADFGASKLAGQTGISEQSLRSRIPRAMSAVLQLAVGSITTVTLVNPRMTISVPDGCIDAPQRFLKPQGAQAPAPASNRAERSTDSKVLVGVRSSKS